MKINRVAGLIHVIRDQRVMLDADLARLYGVGTRDLNKAVKRNVERFPADFMFQLGEDEWRALMFQIGTSNDGRGGNRHRPHAFTEQGVAMLSSVLKSPRAVQVNIEIMRVFVKLRRALATGRDLSTRMKQRRGGHQGARPRADGARRAHQRGVRGDQAAVGAVKTCVKTLRMEQKKGPPRMYDMNIAKIGALIYVVRGQRVMLDHDLAAIYGTEVLQLKRQVRRNLERFPKDFMLTLTREEYESLRCQIGILKRGRHAKYSPFAFTEQGVAMLSGVLHSPRAVEANIAIMRAFVQLRSALVPGRDLAERVTKIEKTQISQEKELGEHAVDIHEVFVALRRLRAPRGRR